ncbi:amino acid adenylation domain-containing protein [Streptomyces fumanus]|uniref:Amino acid adenylation domain-containing protein n=1 Tax=Streptomyces fumanus TaxID=67302 RepID=A0A919ABQ0_9ACTN|nr:amino acid adenylation domain-containing protein [Streptomyces fumanus]GHE97471.1 hypothetical protein GCM10018772_22120 [Streptomyces fumanus]
MTVPLVPLPVAPAAPPPPDPAPHILDLVEPHLSGPAPAVADRDGAFDYTELAARSGAVAARLLALGTLPGEAVVVHAPLSRWAVAAMLGVLRAGARFVPVDAHFPAARRQAMVHRAGARYAVCPPGRPTGLPPGVRPVPDAWQPLPGPVRSHRGQTAYTCFTSGSTGPPRPVTVPSRALGWSTAARIASYREPPRAFLLCSSISFDSSMAGIWWTLATGGLLLIPAERPGDPLATARAAQRHRATHLLMVPSLYALLLRSRLAPRLSSLTTTIVAGEVCPPALVEAHTAALPETRLYNEYGPTECTVWSTVHLCTPQDARAPRVPLGRPAPGARLYHPAGAGGTTTEPAELWIGGPGVAHGPPGDPRFTEHEGRRVYRTGDLVAVGADGLLHFHGRADHQLKLGGARIERAEIEQALAAYGGITEAGVGIRRGGRPRVVAYLVPDGPPPDPSALRAHLLTHLPAAALPTRLVTLPALPRLPNGKIDHTALDRRTAEDG